MPSFYEANFRHAICYQKYLSALSSEYAKGGDLSQLSMLLFEIEWENINLGQSWVSNYRNSSDQTILELIVDYPMSGISILLGMRSSEIYLEWMEKAALVANLLSDQVKEAEIIGHLAIGYSNVKRYIDAVKMIHRQLMLALKTKNKELKERALGNLGVSYLYLSEDQTKRVTIERKQRYLSKALFFSKEALSLSKDIGYRYGEASSLTNIGIIYRVMGQVQESIDIFNQALEIAREEGNKHAEALIITNIGRSYLKLNDRLNALNQYSKADEIAMSSAFSWHNHYYTVRSFAELYADEDPQKSKEFYEIALDMAHHFNDRLTIGNTLVSLGNVYGKLGLSKDQVKAFQEAEVIFQGLNDYESRLYVIITLGDLYKKMGDLVRAYSIYEKGLELAREKSDRFREWFIWNEIGIVHNRDLRFGDAIASFENAIAITQKENDLQGEGRILGNLATSYLKSGQLDKSIEIHNRQLLIAKETGDKYGEGVALTNIGNTHLALHEYDKAIDSIQRGIVFSREVGNKLGEAQSLNSLGLAYIGLDKHQNAQEALLMALPIIKETGDLSLEADTLVKLSKVYQLQNNIVRTVEAAREAINLLILIESPKTDAVRQWLEDTQMEKLYESEKFHQVKIEQEKAAVEPYKSLIDLIVQACKGVELRHEARQAIEELGVEKKDLSYVLTKILDGARIFNRLAPFVETPEDIMVVKEILSCIEKKRRYQ